MRADEVPSKRPWVPRWRWLLVVSGLVVSSLLVMITLGRGSAAQRQTGPARSAKVVLERTNKAALADLRARGGALVADRGRYLVYAADANLAAQVAADHGAVLRDDFDSIWLRRGPIDTRRGPVAAPGALSARGGARRLKLVQFPAPPVDDDLERLQSTGARIVHYVPQNAYIVWSDSARVASDLQSLAGPGGLQYVGEYYPDYALDPALDQKLGGDDRLNVTVQIYNHGPGAADDASAIERLSEGVLAEATERSRRPLRQPAAGSARRGHRRDRAARVGGERRAVRRARVRRAPGPDPGRASSTARPEPRRARLPRLARRARLLRPRGGLPGDRAGRRRRRQRHHRADQQRVPRSATIPSAPAASPSPCCRRAPAASSRRRPGRPRQHQRFDRRWLQRVERARVRGRRRVPVRPRHLAVRTPRQRAHLRAVFDIGFGRDPDGRRLLRPRRAGELELVGRGPVGGPTTPIRRSTTR